MAAPMMSTSERLIGMPVIVNQAYPIPHYIYYKRHTLTKGDGGDRRPADRTILAANIPPYCSEAVIRRLFADCGKIERVDIQEKPGAPIDNTDKPTESSYFQPPCKVLGFKLAYIVFKKPGSVNGAVQKSYPEPLVLTSKDTPVTTGLHKWCSEYQDSHLMDTGQLQEEVDAFMQNFDSNKKQEEDTKPDEGEEDGEGWVTVSRKGRKSAAPHTEKHRTRTLARERKKRKQKELLSFYSYQLRESRREHIAQLRKKYEVDKEKIAVMKANRKFRPM